MWRDPIVEEIHAIRNQIARECDYDLKRLVERLREKEREYPGRVVHKEELTASRRTSRRPSAEGANTA